MANRGRSVDFTVRAKDEFSKVLDKLEAQQNKLSASAKATNRRTLLAVSKDEIQAASDSYKRLNADVERYRKVQADAAKSGSLTAGEMRELGDSISLVRQRSRDAMQALQQKRAALNQIVGSSTSGYTAFNRLATVMEKSGAAASQESAAVASTAAQLNKLTSASNTASSSQAKLKSQLTSTTASIQKQRLGSGSKSAKGDTQDVEIYGLKPWQMTNLGYQINDVVSGLAMGQRPMQVFAQQAGQIAQIWPKVMVTLVRSIPQILGLTAAFAPFIAAALRMKEAGDTLKYFNQQLAFQANGGEFSAKGLTQIALGLQAIGVAADDSRTMVSGFMKQGIKSSQFSELGAMSKALAAFSGKTIIEEAERLGKAFGGSTDEIIKLDEELNFLTADQLASVLAMKQSKDAAGAAAIAQEALSKKLQDAKAKGSTWGDTMRTMGEAWNSLVKLAERTGIIGFLADEFQKFGRDVDKLAKEFKELADAINSIGAPASLGEIDKQITELRDKMSTSTGDPVMDSLNNNRVQAELDDLLTTRREILTTIKEEGALTQNTAEGVENRRKAEASIQGLINSKLADMREELRIAELSKRERFIEQQVIEARNKALEEAKRLNQDIKDLTAGQLNDIKNQAGALYEQQQLSSITSNSSNVVDKIIGVESNGNPNAQPRDKNGKLLSSATGLGQFIESTWLKMFKQHFPDRAQGMTDKAILMLRTNADLSRQMVELYVRENATLLNKAGVAVNDASIYLAHFLGPGGAIAVLQAKVNTPVSELLGSDKINANKSILQGKTAGQVTAWATQKMGISDPEVAARKTLTDLDAKRLETEKEYQLEYTKRVEQQKFELSLIAKGAKEAAIAKAVRDEEVKAKAAGLQLTKEQRAETEKLAAAEFDNKNANLEVNQLMEQRKALLESLEIAQLAGDQGKAESVIEQIAGVEEKLQSAIALAIQFWTAMGGDGAAAAIQSLQNMQAGLGKTLSTLETKYLPTAQSLNEQLADIGSNAFSAFAQAIANGENAADAFFNALRQGLADFLIQIGKAIIQQAIFNAISGAGGGGGIGGSIAGFVGGLFGAKHTGGLIGQPGMNRMVNPAIFNYASKHHAGGVIGRLGSNEVPIVGLRDEEVLTTDDPRHRYNGGGGTSVNVKNVNVIDPREVLENALQSTEGERIMINWLSRNANKVSGALGN